MAGGAPPKLNINTSPALYTICGT